MKKALAVLFSFSLLLFVSAPLVQAKTLYQESGTVNVAKNEVISDDLFAAADTVNIEGVVNGDVFIGAETVRISGKIDGNLHIGAGTVTLSGPVSGNVYIGAGTLSLEGAKIGGSVLAGTGTLTTDAATTVGRSLIAGTGTINNKATVGRNLILGAGTVDLNSAVGGEANLGGGKINIGPEASIAGDLTYATDDKANLTMSESATVGGQINRIETKTTSRFKMGLKAGVPETRSAKFGFGLISFLGALIVGLLWVKLIPKSAQDVSKQVGDYFFSNLGVGLLVSILAFPAFLLMAITIIGLPLAGILFVLLMVSLYLSKIAVGLWAGSFVGEKFGWKKMSQYASFALGLLVVYLLKSLPIAGLFFGLVFCLTGLGALSIYFRSKLAGK